MHRFYTVKDGFFLLLATKDYTFFCSITLLVAKRLIQSVGQHSSSWFSFFCKKSPWGDYCWQMVLSVKTLTIYSAFTTRIGTFLYCSPNANNIRRLLVLLLRRKRRSKKGVARIIFSHLAHLLWFMAYYGSNAHTQKSHGTFGPPTNYLFLMHTQPPTDIC